MPARQEALHVPSISQRVEQSAVARGANIDSFRMGERQRVFADLASHGVFSVPVYDAPETDISLPQLKTILPVIATIALLNTACAVQPRTPTGAPGADLPNRPVASEPSSPSLPDALANENAARAAAGKPPLEFSTPVPPPIQTAQAEADQIKKDREAAARAEAAAQAAKPEPVVVKPGAVETAKAGETAKQPEILQDELAKSIESLINMVQNPDPAIVAQYRFPQGRIESNQRMILSGALDKNVPGLTFILEDTIRTKRDLPLAKKQLEKIFKNAILDHTVLPDDSDRVILPEEQKPLYDPTGVYFTKGAFDTFSAINKDLGLATVQVLYQFDGKTTGPQGK